MSSASTPYVNLSHRFAIKLKFYSAASLNIRLNNQEPHGHLNKQVIPEDVIMNTREMKVFIPNGRSHKHPSQGTRPFRLRELLKLPPRGKLHKEKALLLQGFFN